MPARALPRLPPFPLFVLAAACVVSVCAALARSQLIAKGAVAAAVSFDLAVTLPLLYWLLVVRAGRARGLTLVPVFAAGLALAAALLPEGHQGILPALRLVAPLAEAVTIGALVLKGRSVLREYRKARPASIDPVEALETALRAGLGNAVLAEVVASEAGILYFALGSWRRTPDARAFGGARRSGFAAIAWALALGIVTETLALHFLLAKWSPRGAWLATAGSLYSLVWLLGFARSLRLRGTTIEGGALRLRVGLRWSAVIPLADLRSAALVAPPLRSVLSLAPPLGTPNVLLELVRPATAHGPFGSRKTGDRLGLLLDEPEAFLQALSQRA